MFAQNIDVNKEENNFLAAYHILKFSKADKDELEKADIERRCIATKYFTARQFASEDIASHLLDKELEDYGALMEDRDGINNYWKQIKMQASKVSNDPQKWKTSLMDVYTAVNFVKALSCQENNTMPCKGRILTDRYIESIANVWKNKETLTRNRKVSTGLRINGSKRSNSDGQTQFVDHTIKHEIDNVTGHVSYIQKHVPKSYPISHENHNYSRQRTLKLEPKAQCNITRSNTFNTCQNNLEQLNGYRNNVKSKSQESVESNGDLDESKPKMNSFKTARQELSIQQMKKANKQGQQKSLGGKVTVNSKFVCPLKREQEKTIQGQGNTCNSESNSMEIEDERLKNIDPKMVELIRNEIMDSKTTISWDDIAGLEYAKKIIKEIVVYPMLRPDIFTGLRRPPKGILLFGPPGTGKTLIGKCIASQSKSTFFSISASSLTSKWIGEGEKMVRALFAVARVFQPSVIFVDEIDSLLTQRSETEHESSRRLKTEFLVQLDGAATAEEDRILIVGATNRPQELDEAARRRLVKRLYVPLPELQARKQIINSLLVTVPHNLTQQDITDMAEQSQGYSGADMSNLCKEASMGPIRSIPFSQLENIKKEDVRHVTVNDFREALMHVRPSVSESSLSAYVEWDSTYGAGTAQNYTAQ